MGLSSSQARLLNLTSRMHQIEYKAAKLEAEKLQMANESSRVYEDYLEALEKTKIQKKILTTDGSITYRDLTSYQDFIDSGFAIVYNNTTYNVVGFVDSRPHSNGYSYYAFHKMWQFLIDSDTKEIKKFSSFSEFLQKKIPSDASKLSIKDVNNNFTSENVEGVLEELFQYASNGKRLIATAITGKGVNTSSNNTFELHGLGKVYKLLRASAS